MHTEKQQFKGQFNKSSKAAFQTVGNSITSERGGQSCEQRRESEEEQKLPPEAAAEAEEQGSEPATLGANMLRVARCVEDTEHAGDE